jgi:hypothetical protein
MRKCIPSSIVNSLSWFTRGSLALWFITVSAVALSAQTGTGRVIGTITDESGGGIAGAKVTVTNALTNVHWETTSGVDGSYQVLDLPIGSYTVAAEHEGFRKAVTAPQQLEINQSLRIDAKLNVGSVAEVVNVEAVAAQVETVSPTVGGTVTGAPIQGLPLNGRNVLDLAFTQPGVVPSSGSPFSGNGVPAGAFSIAGGHDNSVTYLLDGGDNTSVTYGNPVMNPNPDTIAEFRILTNNYTAEYGRSAGGVVSVVTKSGTNQFHGSAYDYWRNTDFNANTFFNKANLQNLQPRPILERNQFGGTLGGPILKDRLFFFFAYQGQRQNSVTVGPLFTTFTPAQLGGDFSGGGQPGSCPNVNTSVAAFLQANPYFQADPAKAACAIIDPTKIDPVAQAYIQNNLIPTTTTGNIVPNGPATDNRNEYNGKIDWNASLKDRFTLTLATFKNPINYPFLTTTSLGSAPNVPGYPGLNTFTSYFGSVAYTRTFSQTVLNEFRFTAQTIDNKLNFPQRSLPGPNGLGINITPDQVTGPTQMLFANSGLQIGFNVNGPANYADTTYTYVDTLSWIKGHHTFKTGGTLGIVQNNAVFDFANNGQFGFYGSGSGSDLADFLLGVPTYFEQFPRGTSAIRSHQYSAFFQDEWKVVPRLVLTLGIRYEYNTPKSDPQKRQYMLLPGLQSVVDPFAPKGLLFAGDPGTPSGINFPDRNDWAPRFGFAWDPRGNGKTSVRGGFGVFYDVLLGQDNQYQNGTVPLFAAAYIGCFNFCLPPPSLTTNYNYLSDPYGSTGFINPFPSAALPPLGQRDFAALGFLPIGYNSVFLDPHMRTPYSYQYNLNVQHQISSSLAAEIGYVGSSSHKFTANVDFDPFVNGGASFLRLQNVLNGYTDPANPIYTSTVGTTNAINGNYNGLVSSLTKRISDWHGLGSTFFTVAYTWSHLIDDGTGIFRNTSQVPYYNHHQFHGTGDNDLRNRFVFSGGWTMPLEKAWSSGPSALTKGWTLYPIFVWQSGLPMDVNGGLYVDGTPGASGAGDQGLLKPNWAGGAAKTLNPRKYQTINGLKGNFIFDPTGLADPSCYYDTTGAQNPNAPGTPGGCPAPTYGTLPRNFFRGPGRVNLDLALEKATPLFKEKMQFIFRAEFFNILNHTEFQNPSGGSASIYSPQLGQVVSTFDPRIGQLSFRLTF